MQNVDEDTITQIVLARHAEATDPRLKQIITSVVQHLHAFARDVQLTEEEWFKGIQFLTDVGHVFRSGDQYLDSDAVFGVRSSLIADWQHHEPGRAPDGTEIDTPLSTLDFTFVLNRANAALESRAA